MRSTSALRREQGLSLVGLIVVFFIVVLVALFGMKLVPSYLEYRSAKNAIDALARSGGATPSDIRRNFENRSVIDGIESVKPSDLDITKQGNQVVISFAYRKEVPLFSNVGLYIDYRATSGGDQIAASLEERLGHRFARPQLLAQALTHRSFGPDHNERLEFLGDGVLGCAVAAELYARFPHLSEGKLTRLRASLVREEALAEVARELGLALELKLGEGEMTASPEPRPSILADALEALFGAVFLDGGYDAARTAMLAAFGARLERLDPEQPAKDAKTELQEVLQAAHRALPVYRVVAVQGAAHRQSFEVECVVQDLVAKGTGSSRQKAEQGAARAMLEKLGA